MSVIRGIISLISADVSSTLIAAGYPIAQTPSANGSPFVDGKILIGRQHIREESSAPRIVMVPLKSRFGPKSVTSAAKVNGYPSAEIIAEWQSRSFATEKMLFSVHCWGQSSTLDPDVDFDATQDLYRTFIASCQRLMAGAYHLVDGEWADQKPAETQIAKAGHTFVFGIEIDTPILDMTPAFGAYGPPPPTLLPTPQGTRIVPTVQITTPNGGTPEIASQG